MRSTDQLRMVLVSGFAGSGKTETGKLLAGATGWALIDKDTITRALVEGMLSGIGADPNDRHTQKYLDKVRPLEYECLLRAGIENLECGCSVILSAPFLQEVVDSGWISRLRRRCTHLDTKVEVVWVDSDVPSMKERLIARGAERDAWKIANWDLYLAGIDLTTAPHGQYFRIDNRIASELPLATQVVVLSRSLLEGQ